MAGQNRMWETALSLIVLSFLTYAGFCLFLYLNQSSLLYFPSSSIAVTPSAVGLAFDDVQLETSDNETLAAWFVPAQKEKGVILFAHGNGGNISHRLDSLQIFHELGYSTLIFDYRGYGKSSGTTDEEGTYRDVSAAWQYLTETKGYNPRQIILFGRSLGGAVVAWLATQVQPAGLIVESTMRSVPALGAELYPLFPVRFLSRYQYNAEAVLKKISCPVLVAHSPQDDIIPFHHGQQLFAVANQPKSFLEMRGDHNSGFLMTGKPYVEGLKGFLATLAPSSL